MRKRNILSIIDHIVWLVVALLPIISYILVCSGNNNSINTNVLDYAEGNFYNGDMKEIAYLNFTSFDAFILSFLGEQIPFISATETTYNIFTMFFIQLLTTDNSVFYCSSIGLILSLSWFCTIQLIHFIVDVLMFIPHICQKFVEVRS